jgi:hypothetical protein
VGLVAAVLEAEGSKLSAVLPKAGGRAAGAAGGLAAWPGSGLGADLRLDSHSSRNDGAAAGLGGKAPPGEPKEGLAENGEAPVGR